MRRWIKAGAALGGGVAAGALAAVAVAARFWDRATARAVERLGAGMPSDDRAVTRPFSPEQLAGLPDPVVRYFTFALTPGQPLVRRARIRQAGEFRMRGDVWSPFSAVQHFSVAPRGFVWDATIRVARLLPVRVRDSYAGGEGAMYAALGALVPLVHQRGTPEMAAGSLVRYLAEAVWLPTALLPSEGVGWQRIDDSAARATLTDGVTTVSLDVHFGPRGEIVRASAERYRDVNGRAALAPWVCHYRDYARVEGMLIPMAGEVEWVLRERRLPYWRGRTVGVEYELGP